MGNYDVAAYIWPAYSGKEPRTRLFWPEGMGEWETVRNASAKYEGHVWPRKPEWGYVNEADPYVMEMQINAAADYGVNVFAYDWYWYDGRPFLENCLTDGYLKARNNDRVKFFIMWANHNVDFLWDIRNSDGGSEEFERGDRSSYLYQGKIDRTQFETMGHYLIENYFSLPNYYKIDGKPVFMVFVLPLLIEGLGGLRKTKEALDWFREECIKAGMNGVYLLVNMHPVCKRIKDENGVLQTSDQVLQMLEFDGLTNYQMVNYEGESDFGYKEACEKAYRRWEKDDSEHAAPYFPQVAVGWDNNPRFKNLTTPIVRPKSPEEFKEALLHAKEFLDRRPDRPRLLTINSWNEWTEGSYLQPDDITGYQYLQAVKDVFGSC